jgi:hypothetical protein
MLVLPFVFLSPLCHHSPPDVDDIPMSPLDSLRHKPPNKLSKFHTMHLTAEETSHLTSYREVIEHKTK